MVTNYIPDKRDIVYINLDPQIGRELAKRRPALVLTGKALNRKLGRALVCPITSLSIRIGTHIPLPTNSKVKGTIVVDQIKSLDYEFRKAEKVDYLGSVEIYDLVIKRLNLMFDV